MTTLTSLGLVAAILIISSAVAYYFQMGQLTTKEWNKKITENLVKQQEIEEKEDSTSI